MGISLKEIVTGRKTFFVTPDTSLLPEAYLEDYFALGYECYFVENDKKVSIQRKLEILISIFRDVIFFFNIDFVIPGVDWDEIIRQITEKYDNQACIGVLYTKRPTKDEKLKLERKYLMDMGLSCGCIQLEYQKKQNFEIIEKILRANQAQGRRKNIRSLCTKACTFSFNFGDLRNPSKIENVASGSLQDISLSHFSFIIPKGNFEVPLYEKVADIHFNIKGFLFRSDAVLLMQRPMNETEVLYVFGFINSTGANGLDTRIKQLLIPNLYHLMSSNTKNLLDQIYAKAEEDLEDLEAVQTFD